MRIWKAVELVTDIFAYVAGILLLLVALFVSYSVTLRYMHYKPPIWILQFTEYALLWITFLGAAWLLRMDGHVRIDTFVMLMGRRLRRVVETVVDLLGSLVCIVILWFGVEKTLDLFRRSVMDVKGISLPEYPLFLIIPVGALLLLLQFGRKFLGRLRPQMTQGEGKPS